MTLYTGGMQKNPKNCRILCISARFHIHVFKVFIGYPLLYIVSHRLTDSGILITHMTTSSINYALLWLAFLHCHEENLTNMCSHIAYIAFFNDVSCYITNEIILLPCPKNWLSTPEKVILPSWKQSYSIRNGYIALPKLLYHPRVQLFCILITSDSKFS